MRPNGSLTWLCHQHHRVTALHFHPGRCGGCRSLAAASHRRALLHTSPHMPIIPQPQMPPVEPYLANACPPILPSTAPTTSMPIPASASAFAPAAPLAALPLGTLLRSLAIGTATASPVLLPPALALLSRIAHAQDTLFSLDRNPLLRFAVKKMLYQQFCAGENAAEVTRSCDRLRRLGFTGVILCYGKEIVLGKGESAAPHKHAAAADHAAAEIAAWRGGNLETVRLAQAGDYVSLKFSGAGRHVVSALASKSPPPEPLATAIDEICSLAIARRVRLLIDAEQAAVQPGIDNWALAFMRKYNTTPDGPTVHNTYQAYLKQTPDVLRAHAETARRDAFALGVKLVRGAYLATDPRHLIHDTKADTDNCFDGLAASLLTRQWSDALPGTGAFPDLGLVVATHNADSVAKARKTVEDGRARTAVSFAQLQGMADELSFGLVGATNGAAGGPTLGAYKYLAWGSTSDCIKYLLRRAEENRDAVQRTRASRDATRAELKRRLRRVVGLS